MRTIEAALLQPTHSFMRVAKCRVGDLMSFVMILALLAAQSAPITTDSAPPSPAMSVAIANKAKARTTPSFIKEPDYARPDAAKAAGEFGDVVLAGIIGEDGKLHEAKIAVSSRSPSIDAVALASVPLMLFEPARDAEGKPLSVPANLPLEYSNVEFHGAGGLAQYRCDQFVRDYDWWYRTWPADKQARVFKTLRGYAAVADMQFGKRTSFDTEWKAAIGTCRRSPDKLMLDQLRPHGVLFRRLVQN